MYKFCDNDGKYNSLHDCIATKATLENGILSFYFPDGFWVLHNHINNPYEKALRTSESKVSFELLYHDDIDAKVYIFTSKKRRILRKKPRRAIRNEIDINDLIRLINQKHYYLEFLSRYIEDYQCIRFDCWLYSNSTTHKECELIISTDNVSYQWNQLCEDRPW